jgi:hypothetical protein
MNAEILLVASICLQGNQQIDISQYVSSTTRFLEVRVSFKPAKGALIIYSPGHEDKKVRLTPANPRGWLAIAQPVLCVKAVGGPFEFDMKIWAAPVSQRDDRQ